MNYQKVITIVESTKEGKYYRTFLQLLKYSVVGGIAFFIDFGTLYFFVLIGINYLISAAIAFLAGLIVNYLLSTKWVFDSRRIANKKYEFIIFGIIGVIGLLLNEVVIYVATEILYMNLLFSKIAATVIVFIWNFAARKKILFDRS